MPQTQLEFRGIRVEHLIEYFLELGGIQKTEKFPIYIDGSGWDCTILSEVEIRITSTFIVNAVQILFKAKTEEILDELLKNYRKKTTRIGG